MGQVDVFFGIMDREREERAKTKIRSRAKPSQDKTIHKSSKRRDQMKRNNQMKQQEEQKTARKKRAASWEGRQERDWLGGRKERRNM